MSAIRPLAVELSFSVKTYDVDYVGIVHNGVYIRWLEDLRLQILSEHFPLEEQLAAGLSPVLERTEILYRRPARMFDTVRGQMWVSRLRKARWEVQAEFADKERLLAEATQSGYFVQLEDLRPVRIPEALRSMWEAAHQSLAEQRQL